MLPDHHHHYIMIEVHPKKCFRHELLYSSDIIKITVSNNVYILLLIVIILI